ncbi:hypothetical protein F5148DRAFT_1221959 [Russula earlei]|uniref:Uncharacterized protein n=1 Tax=Russula earlei TaxID=71964 RepID=A0ACC0U1Z2_9AGAM|nr:hypothetical protein F5148DRAFT_1221959 [Russula earlei]
MSTAAPKATPSPSPRRSSSISSHPNTTTITRGATARSAINPRVSASLNPPRRTSVKSTTPPPVSRDATEVLAASLKRETEEKERLLIQLQNKDQTITTLTEETVNFSTALNTAETRLYEFYAEQARMEEELAARIEVTEKLRAQVRELEKEKRDLHRRYNEQTATFEAERQAFYDNENHLKSRIQSLTQVRSQEAVPRSPNVPDTPEAETEDDVEEEVVESSVSSHAKEDLDAEPAELTALKLELSTLSTSYASLQSTLVLLQTQLVDLKRVNNQLQEENESYNILLREKTLSGQYDLFRRVGGDRSSYDEDSQTDDMADVQSMRSGAHSSQLGTVDEHPNEDDLQTNFGADRSALMQNSDDEGSLEREGSNRGGKRNRHGRSRHGGSSRSPVSRGECLAGLPITGPGLDLAAELGRAENRGISEDQTDDVSGPPRDKRGKKLSSESRKGSAPDAGMERTRSLNEVDTLRNEIKSLKDANKALSLYASKIIDRIIAQEGFEHVLAIDYDAKSPATPTVPVTSSHTSAEADKKSKRRNTMYASSDSNPPPRVEKLTTFNSPPPNNSPPQRSNRRSLSFDWRALSSFVSGDKDKKPDTNPNLRPLTLKPGTRIGGARKLETLEDEEDRRERERLNATMKLMGIEKPPLPQRIQSVNALSETSTPTSTAESVASSSLVSRFSLFRRTTATPDLAANSSAAALQGSPQGNPTNLTHDTLVQAQAEESLAALDAQERMLSAEMAKGGNGGFTEILPRRKSGSRRSYTSGGGSGSGSTVWSAGMSRAGEDD